MVAKQDQQPEDEACVQKVHLAFAFPAFVHGFPFSLGQCSGYHYAELNFRAQELFLDLKQERDGQGSAEEKASDVSFHTNVLQI